VCFVQTMLLQPVWGAPAGLPAWCARSRAVHGSVTWWCDVACRRSHAPRCARPCQRIRMATTDHFPGAAVPSCPLSLKDWMRFVLHEDVQARNKRVAQERIQEHSDRLS
jgi:hypothetical protein